MKSVRITCVVESIDCWSQPRLTLNIYHSDADVKIKLVLVSYIIERFQVIMLPVGVQGLRTACLCV